MKSESELARILEREKGELTARIHAAYWNNHFKALFKEHTYQSGYFLVPANLSMKDVAEYCSKLFAELCSKYGLTVTESNGAHRTEFIIKIYFDQKKKMKVDELSVVICENDITLRIFPYNPLLKQFMLEEYVLAANIITELFDVVFNRERKQFDELAAETAHIEACSKKITSKSIEIARNSIRAIYFQKDKSNHTSFVQKTLYSSFLKDGKIVWILHKDFLKDPGVLIDLFGEE